MASNNDKVIPHQQHTMRKYGQKCRLTSKGEKTTTAVYILLEVVQVTFLSDEVGDVDRNVEYAVIGIL